MAVNPKERKEKKDIAKKIMEHYDINYNDWLHKQHETYINENLMEYMKDLEKKSNQNMNNF